MVPNIINHKLAFLVGVLLVCTVMFTSGLLWLVSAERSLPVVADYIELQLDGLSSRYDFSVGNVTLNWRQASGSVILDVQDLKMFDLTNNIPILTVPNVRIEPSLRDIIVGQLVIDSVVMHHPHVNYAVGGANGSLRSVSDTSSSMPTIHRELLRRVIEMLASFDQVPIRYAQIRDAGFGFDNGERNIRFSLPNTEIRIERERRNMDNVLALTLSSALEYDDNSVLLTGEAILDSDNILKIETHIVDISLDDVRALYPKFKWLKQVDRKFTGTAQLHIDSTGMFNELRLYLDSIRQGNEDISSYALVTFDSDKEHPVAQSVLLNGRVDNFDISRLPLYWPEGLEPIVRKWLVENMQQGHVTEAGVTVKLTPEELKRGLLKDESLKASLMVEDATLKVFHPKYPLMENVKGKVDFSGNYMWLSEASATWQDMVIDKVRGKISDLSDIKKTQMGVTGHAVGPLSDVLVIGGMSTPEVKKIAAHSGQTDTNFYVNIPMYLSKDGPNLPTFAGISKFSDVTLEDGRTGTILKEGSFDVAVDFDTTFMMHGPVTIDDVRGDLRVYNRGKEELVQFTTQWDAQRFRALKLPEIIIREGHAPLRYVQVSREDQNTAFAEFGFENLDLHIPYLNYTPFGKVGSKLAFYHDAKRETGDNVKAYLRALDASFDGGGYFDGKEQALKRLSLLDIKNGLSDFNLDYVIDDHKNVHMQVYGKSFNASEFVGNIDDWLRGGALTEGEGSTQVTRNIHVSIDKVYLPKQQTVEDFRLTLQCKPNELLCGDLDITSIRDDKQAFAFSIHKEVQKEGQSQVEAYAHDAGWLLKTLDMSERVKGGKASLTASLKGDSFTLEDGKIEVKDFAVKQAVLLGKILNILSVDVVDLLQGSGIDFKGMSGEFAYEDGILSVKKMLMAGNSLGITVAGDVDFTQRSYDMGGAIIPAYLLNSFLGNIPLLGNILVGKKGEGIIATRYVVEGGFDEPSVSVNPLSMFTPGFLRHIWGGK